MAYSKIRTNSKAFKTQVQEHIKNGLMDRQELKDQYGTEADNDNLLKEQLKLVNNEFSRWYGAYEQKGHPNKQDAFTDWLDGLPGCINTEYEYHNVHETMKSWFENAGGQYDKAEPDTKEYQLYKNLVYREYRTLADKNGIKL